MASMQSGSGMWRALRAALLFCGLAPAAQAVESVSLQLKWSHSFLAAGFYAAQAKGYYREAGLDVHIEAAKAGDNPLQNVLDGHAEYGVGNSSLLLARRDGQPVVVLAVLLQHSAAVLLARQTGTTPSIHNIVGKRVMLEAQHDEILAYLKHEGIPLGRIIRVEHSFDPRDLIDGKVDFVSAYETNDFDAFHRAGVAYHMYTPRSAGIDFYGNNLFTTEHELKSHPRRVAAFREASLRGWQYAMAHPEEIADLIVAEYSQQHPREFYLHQAKRMAPLMQTELIEIGYMNPGRWRHIVDIYADLGLLPRDFSLDGFLYQPNPKLDLTWLYIAGALLAIVSAVAYGIFRVNRRLAQVLAASRKMQAALSVSEARHRLLADNASDLIWMMDLEGRRTYISPSVERLRGFFVEEALQQSLGEVMTPESATIAEQHIASVIGAIRARQPVPEFRGELEQRCKGGGTVWTEVSINGICDASGEFIGLLGIARDISQHRQATEDLRQMAQHDQLTGLPNRALFSDRLRQVLAECRRDGTRLALMFIDLDKFKAINDTLGHGAGDRSLREVALRTQNCVRESDTVARIGGDEFVVLLRCVDSEKSALQVAEKVRHSLAQPYHLNGTVVALSASIGVALYPDHGRDEAELCRNADMAMYEAKGAGRDKVRMTQAG